VNQPAIVINPTYVVGQRWDEDVTPERARCLVASQRINRSWSKRDVDSYAEEMRAGEWRQTGVPIIVDEIGRMFDGQHRMRAVMAAGMTFPFVFTVGRYEDLMLVIDTGKKRTFADVLGIAGIKRFGGVANAVRNYAFLCELEKKPGVKRVSDMKTPDFWKLYKSIPDDLWQRAAQMRNYNDIRDLKLGVASGACYAAFAQVGKDLVEHYFQKLNSGAGLAEDDPILCVRRTSLRMVNDPARNFDMRTKLFLLVKGWNMWIEGASVAKFHIAGQNFPKVQSPI